MTTHFISTPALACYERLAVAPPGCLLPRMAAVFAWCIAGLLGAGVKRRLVNQDGDGPPPVVEPGSVPQRRQRSDARPMRMSTNTHPALAREERNINQLRLPATLGIAQQTLARCEGGRLRLPASLLPVLAQELQRPGEDLLGQPSQAKARAERGPVSALARHIGRINVLPKTQQKFVMQMIETVLAQQGR